MLKIKPEINEQQKWSGVDPIPDIGQRVFCNMNDLGFGVVLGYDVTFGWICVWMKFDDPPEWYIRQNGPDNPPGAIWGIDLR